MTAIERKAADKLIAAISQPNFSNVVFADAIRNAHPTHQQSVMRAFMACVDTWYNMYAYGHYDMRNEGTVTAAARMREALDANPIALPYI